jgi:hypothetical protein
MVQGQHKNASLRLGGADYTPIDVSKVGKIKIFARAAATVKRATG